MDARVQKAIERLTADLGAEFSLSDLANTAGLSRSYFSRLFRSEAGMSPRQYLLELRMEKAKELLATTGLGVRGVMAAVGFRDKRNFLRRFKETSGVTPVEYRKRLREGHQRGPPRF